MHKCLLLGKLKEKDHLEDLKEVGGKGAGVGYNGIN
jgi:hypothetical protein